ncbi:MAG: hypothetical protein WCS65_14265 [Verrucomicrobiae bacterium]
MMTDYPIRNRAFSLVEIVLALGLASFSMLAIFALVAQGQKTSREARLESVAAILAGKVTSQLRASAAWDTSDTNNYLGGSTLAQVASGATVTLTNYYDLNLSNVTTTKPEDRQFSMRTEVGPVSAAGLSSANAEVASALANLGNAGNTVFLNIEISYPALAPEANRSKRSFSSIITRTSKD